MQKTCNVTHYICFAPSIFLLEFVPEEWLNKNKIGFFLIHNALYISIYAFHVKGPVYEI